MIVVVAEGEVTRSELEALIDAIKSDELLTYRKLFDGTKAATKMLPEDFIALGVQMRETHIRGGLGPLALVVPAEMEKLLERVIGILAVPKRPMRVFNDADQARRWIKKQLPGSRD